MPSLFQLIDSGADATALKAIEAHLAGGHSQQQLRQRFQQPQMPTTMVVYSQSMSSSSHANPVGMTPFHYALFRRKYACARALLLRDPSVLRLTNADGDLPLHEVARLPVTGRLDFLSEPLIKSRLDNFAKSPPPLENFNGETPLTLAIKQGDSSVEELQLWAKLGCDVSRVDRQGWHAVHYATFMHNNDLLDYLLHHHAETVLLRTEGNKGPQHYAAQVNNARGLALCVRAGASLQAVDDQDDTPLHMAARFGSWEALCYLLTNGGMNNNHNFDGYTPLQLAILHFKMFEGHEEGVFSALFNGGADPFVKATDNDGLNAHQMAREYLDKKQYAQFKRAYDDTFGKSPLTPDMLIYQFSQVLGEEERAIAIAALNKAAPRTQHGAIREAYHAILIEALKVQSLRHLPLEEAGVFHQLLQKLQGKPFPHEPFEASNHPKSVEASLAMERDLAALEATRALSERPSRAL